MMRRGFTLVEVLLAIGLTTLLMAAVYAAMNSYWTLAVESHDEIERFQIARAVLKQVSRDIGSVTFTEQETVTSDDDDSDDTSMTSSNDTATYTDGIVGTASDLVLYISRPDRGLNYVAPQQQASGSDRSSDMVIVRYLLADAQMGGLSAAIAGREKSGQFSGPAGLARVYGDLYGLSDALQKSNLDLQLQASTLIAPEVMELKFQYFDGVEWQTEWDSTELNTIPLAIEIVLTLATLDEDGQVDSGPKALPPTQHRLVVPIPVATPYVGESAL
ncbi:MAG: prepilin-type N-terminal cleavage/methylation domain-containing protein [Planctomycetaceae bacterium]